MNKSFISEKEKSKVIAAFSRNDFQNHSGISGLKYYLVVMYLRKHAQIFGEISFTLNKLLNECGYLTKSHNLTIYIDFRRIIKYEIIDKGFATSDDDIMTIAPGKMYTMKLSEKKSLFYTDQNYVCFNIKEFETIVQSDNKMNNSILAGVYLFIKQYILSDSSTNNQMPKIAYPSKAQIAAGTGISVYTVESAIAILESLGMIYVGRGMYIEDYKAPGYYIPARNVYALNKKDLKDEVVFAELENVYSRPVYKSFNVPGTIKYLPKNDDTKRNSKENI